MANPSVESYKRLLKRIPPRVKKAAAAALTEGATKMVASMNTLVPRDSGKLASTIRMEMDADGLAVTIRAGGPATTKPVRDGADKTYDYALAQEFGTEDKPAHPFFWPSYRLFKKPVRAKVKRLMKKAIVAEGGGQ